MLACPIRDYQNEGVGVRIIAYRKPRHAHYIPTQVLTPPYDHTFNCYKKMQRNYINIICTHDAHTVDTGKAKLQTVRTHLLHVNIESRK